ncbi:MAG: DUF424 family protein [Candidatus Hodarchaeales archaeon]|jgi:hypothetical protein
MHLKSKKSRSSNSQKTKNQNLRKASLLEIKEKIKGKEVYFKEHRSLDTIIQAFSDPELIGQKIKTKKFTFHVNPNFYQGRLIPLENALEMIQRYPNCNIIGRLAYYAGKLGLVDMRSILWIHEKNTKRKIPHLIIMRT